MIQIEGRLRVFIVRTSMIVGRLGVPMMRASLSWVISRNDGIARPPLVRVLGRDSSAVVSWGDRSPIARMPSASSDLVKPWRQTCRRVDCIRGVFPETGNDRPTKGQVAVRSHRGTWTKESWSFSAVVVTSVLPSDIVGPCSQTSGGWSLLSMNTILVPDEGIFRLNGPTKRWWQLLHHKYSPTDWQMASISVGSRAFPVARM